jgi:hypothetical protein
MPKRDDLANTMAAGLRAVCNEMRAQRRAIEQLQTVVVEYSRNVEARDARRAEDISRLQEEVRELQRQDAE